jgi:hypothetical protein
VAQAIGQTLADQANTSAGLGLEECAVIGIAQEPAAAPPLVTSSSTRRSSDRGSGVSTRSHVAEERCEMAEKKRVWCGGEGGSECCRAQVELIFRRPGSNRGELRYYGEDQKCLLSMPLDHFVSQVHLKNFNSPALGELMYAFRKSNSKSFPTKAQDACRITDHNTSPFLQQPRAIEDFLKEVEPKYNASLKKIRDNKIDRECIHCIAGFVAYVITCSPAALRLNAEPLKAAVEAVARLADAKGVFSRAPASLGSKTLTEILGEGGGGFSVDPKYPQAIGINSIQHHVSVFGNSAWEILRNFQDDTPFFTSDYPVAVEVINLTTPINRVVPLAPDLALRIRPDTQLRGAPDDPTFAKFRSTRRALKRHEVVNLNRLIVQCAEEVVFYCDDWWWIDEFLAKNR